MNMDYIKKWFDQMGEIFLIDVGIEVKRLIECAIILVIQGNVIISSSNKKSPMLVRKKGNGASFF